MNGVTSSCRARRLTSSLRPGDSGLDAVAPEKVGMGGRGLSVGSSRVVRSASRRFQYSRPASVLPCRSSSA
ncbi:MAG: hypothetical protein HY815_08025 [Candidatus Riflebacteria bacterium]|nr:hypothetical protein [Candidatus Riflebacteria bacterium]